jgi:hypothetical protein
MHPRWIGGWECKSCRHRTRVPGAITHHPPLVAGLRAGIETASHGSTAAMCRLGSRLGGWYPEGDQARSDLVRTMFGPRLVVASARRGQQEAETASDAARLS